MGIKRICLECWDWGLGLRDYGFGGRDIVVRLHTVS